MVAVELFDNYDDPVIIVSNYVVLCLRATQVGLSLSQNSKTEELTQVS